MLTRPDKGWAWVVLVASFGGHIITGCFMYAVGIIHIAMLERFEGDVTKTSWAGALFLCLFSSASPLAGVIINRYSCRVSMIIGSLIMCIGFLASALLTSIDWIILSFGGIAGLGGGLAYSSHFVVIGFNFDKKRNIASGIAVSGSGMGAFLMAPVLEASREVYGNTGLFYICAGIALHHCVFGALFYPSYLEEHRKELHKTLLKNVKRSRTPLSRSVVNYCRIIQNLPLISLCFSMGFANVGIYLLYIHFPEYVLITNASPMKASLLVSVSGICNCFARLLSGMAANSHDIDETLMYFGSFGLLGISSVLFPFYATSFPGQVVFAVFLGLYSGCCYSVLKTMTIQIAGIVNLASAVGLILIFTGAGTLVGPPLAGFIIDNGGSYERSFFIAGYYVQFHSVSEWEIICMANEYSLERALRAISVLQSIKVKIMVGGLVDLCFTAYQQLRSFKTKISYRDLRSIQGVVILMGSVLGAATICSRSPLKDEQRETEKEQDDKPMLMVNEGAEWNESSALDKLFDVQLTVDEIQK